MAFFIQPVRPVLYNGTINRIPGLSSLAGLPPRTFIILYLLTLFFVALILLHTLYRGGTLRSEGAARGGSRLSLFTQ